MTGGWDHYTFLSLHTHLYVVVEGMHVPHLAIPVLVATDEQKQLANLPAYHRCLLGHHVLTQVVRPGWLKLSSFSKFFHLLM